MAQALEILIVDDDAPLREMLARSFTREGHIVTAASDGEEALAAASVQPFDIILLDVALGPGPAGHDVARELRARRSVVPIIMLTALDSEADAMLAAAHAEDKGWERSALENAARRAYSETYGEGDVHELHLVQVVDRPGTEEDQAVFRVVTDRGERTLVLGRRDGAWVAT